MARLDATAVRAEERTPMDRLDRIIAMPDALLAAEAPRLADELLVIGEAALESWIVARGQVPISETSEGFRLLALHRQGARGDASFNACRETCRELVYHRNCVHAEAASADVGRTLRLGAMVARHLVLFIDGKLENAGLGEFCCSSRPMRAQDAGHAASAP
jgi:hypothetical protein